jgi:hypothetical protein
VSATTCEREESALTFLFDKSSPQCVGTSSFDETTVEDESTLGNERAMYECLVFADDY